MPPFLISGYHFRQSYNDISGYLFVHFRIMKKKEMGMLSVVHKSSSFLNAGLLSAFS